MPCTPCHLQVGYDSSAHIAEETKNAAVAGPVGLVTAIIGERMPCSLIAY